MKENLKTVNIVITCLFVMSGLLGLVNRGTVEDREPPKSLIEQQKRHDLYDLIYHEDGQRRDLREVQ